jgi:hypothetical protein
MGQIMTKFELTPRRIATLFACLAIPLILCSACASDPPVNADALPVASWKTTNQAPNQITFDFMAETNKYEFTNPKTLNQILGPLCENLNPADFKSKNIPIIFANQNKSCPEQNDSGCTVKEFISGKISSLEIYDNDNPNSNRVELLNKNVFFQIDKACNPNKTMEDFSDDLDTFISTGNLIVTPANSTASLN